MVIKAVAFAVQFLVVIGLSLSVFLSLGLSQATAVAFSVAVFLFVQNCCTVPNRLKSQQEG